MPRVKIDYIVSFSSEDPENPASNLLSWEVTNKKWLCSKGESSCSVVLQLAQAVLISEVHIGGHNAALVEVLAGRSAAPAAPYEVLVPRAVLQAAAEARRGERPARVRSFAGAALAPAAAQRWDRLRVLCDQPYARAAQCGLSFVHVYSPEAATAPEDDEEEFRPGELFAAAGAPGEPDALRANPKGSDRIGPPAAEIRRATSRALRNVPDSSVKLARTPGTKATRRRDDRGAPAPTNSGEVAGDQSGNDGGGGEPGWDASRRAPPASGHGDGERSTTDGGDGPSAERAARAGGVLRGVVFALSGYENPRRARVRDAALALGARCERDWGPACTHLICAFPHTPKLRAARAGPGGERAIAVRAEWVEACARLRRRLPWEWFATEPARRREPPADWDRASGSESADTDDEIERARRKKRNRRAARTPSPGAARGSAAATAASPPDEPAGDERIEEWERASTDEEGEAEQTRGARAAPLPAPLAGRALALSAPAAAAARLARYVRAYGGTVLPEDDPAAELVVCAAGDPRPDEGNPRFVRAEWLWRRVREARPSAACGGRSDDE